MASEPKTPISETATSPAASKEKELQGNGHLGANDRNEQRKGGKKEKERERKERMKAEREKQQGDKVSASPSVEAAGSPAKTPASKGSGKVTPDPSTSATPPPTVDGAAASVKAIANEGDPTSPILSAGESSGLHTPTSRRPARNPWTLFIKLPAPVADQELRDFFQDAKEGITKINMPPNNYGKGRVAYVEFGDEEAMKEGLTKHAEVSFVSICLSFLSSNEFYFRN
jgi:hypothetical protein